MALAFLEALRHSMLNEITTLLDADVGAAELRIYNGSRPATGGAATTLLATCVMTDPAAAVASGGVLTFSAIAPETSATAGTASWFRCVDNTGDFVMDGDVATAASDLNLNTVTIGAGATVSITGFTITAPNA